MTSENIVYAAEKWSKSRRDVSRDIAAQLEQHWRLTPAGDTRVSKWLRPRVITCVVYAILTSADEFDVTTRSRQPDFFKHLVPSICWTENVAMADLALGELSGDQTEKVLQFQVQSCSFLILLKSRALFLCDIVNDVT